MPENNPCPCSFQKCPVREELEKAEEEIKRLRKVLEDISFKASAAVIEK